MGLLELLPNSDLGRKGQTPEIRGGASKESTLHYESSINNNPGISRVPSNLDLDGETPQTRAGALNTSQMHAQGNMGDEAPGFGRINNDFIASTPQEATNLNYKLAGEYSQLDLNGQTPDKYTDNLPR